jgi:hypothetical protein
MLSASVTLLVSDNAAALPESFVIGNRLSKAAIG